MLAEDLHVQSSNPPNQDEIKVALRDWMQIIKKYKKANTNKAIIQVANTFLPFIAIWILMYFSLSWSYWITMGLAIVNAFFLTRVFIIQHDCGHQSFLASTKWNNRIGFFCSFFTSIPYNYWARVHNYHHGHVGQLEHRNVGDINFLTTEEYRNLPRWRRFAYRTFRNPIFMFAVVPAIYLLISNRFPFFKFKGWGQVRRSQIINNIAMLAVFCLFGFTLGWKTFLMVHIPIIFFFGAISFWFFYIQHQHEETYMRWKDNWDYLTAAIKGSTYYKLPKMFMWLSGNIGFHHIHHLSSHIPNYNLAKCAKENPILQKYVKTLTFKDSLKTMSSKLYDEQKQRMISFKEYYKHYSTAKAKA